MSILNDFEIDTVPRYDRRKEYESKRAPRPRTDYHRRYYHERNADVRRERRARYIPEFVGVDSEGIGQGRNHRAVLLGVGQESYVAKDLNKGLQWREVFEFLYAQFERKPKAAFVGFFLSYDFNQWLRTLPEKAAEELFTPEGRLRRRRKDGKGWFPVKCFGWEIDMLGMKRLSIRPMTKPEESPRGWMHICDAGPFFQMAFLKVIDPMGWKDDPDGPVCTPEEYKKIQKGKKRRATAKFDAVMIEYNNLENEVLSRVMERLAKGFLSCGVKLDRDCWYGPGASADKWLRVNNALRADALESIAPEWFLEACRRSYYGGWFEIFSHGLIKRKLRRRAGEEQKWENRSWNYDINNAYPYASTNLPCICGRSNYKRGNGPYNGDGNYVLLYCTVRGSSSRIGPVPYRKKDGSILRPKTSIGWYWKRELDAAHRAGIVKEVEVVKWAEFVPCDHPNPYSIIRELYNLRLQVGKKSSQGMAIKLLCNSLYGKWAQSIGNAPFNNWFYASYITSHCRVQILDAIATHPEGVNSVLMVATDGVCFDSRHTSLPVSKELGEWEESCYEDLYLFKPGVYWHKSGKEKALEVKSRGVPRKEFAKHINQMEWLWHGFDEYTTRWPQMYIPVGFSMKSCRQALHEGKWNSAGNVKERTSLWQSSDPVNKRDGCRYNHAKQRIDSFVYDLPVAEIHSTPYRKRRIKYDPNQDLGYGPDGDTLLSMGEMVNAYKEE